MQSKKKKIEENSKILIRLYEGDYLYSGLQCKIEVLGCQQKKGDLIITLYDNAGNILHQRIAKNIICSKQLEEELKKLLFTGLFDHDAELILNLIYSLDPTTVKIN